MKIALDFDGVLSNTMGRWVQIFNETESDKYNMIIEPNDVIEWGFYKRFKMSDAEGLSIFNRCWKDWEQLEPTEYNIGAKVGKLIGLAKSQLDIVTSSNSKYEDSLVKYLDHYEIPYRSIVYSENKHALDYDVYIDDNPSSISKMFGAGKIALLYNQIWNRGMLDMKGVEPTQMLKRIYNLDHAYDILIKTKQ